MKLKTRRPKAPITAPLPVGPSSSANPLASARLIRRFHVLLKRRAQLEKVRASPENAGALADVDAEIAALGGLEAYQRMSAIGQGDDRGGGSERVFVEWLREMGVQKERTMQGGTGKGKMKVLEVGALKPDNYALCASWIDAHPIDLRSRHPRIAEQDFLCMDQTEHAGAWDAVSLSLVVNFVPEPRDRGRMLRYAHDMLREGGFLFLALPLPCVSNSRYLTFEHLTRLMQHIGFDLLRERWRAGGKMAYWLFGRRAGGKDDSEDNAESSVRFDKKVVLREGKRNNFCILL
ncbi:hypothetical protein M0805_003908 [Coniferiporia weirii]|nr:hypothetical protein M0805_003908 [Coniferiporia weirii]